MIVERKNEGNYVLRKINDFLNWSNPGIKARRRPTEIYLRISKLGWSVGQLVSWSVDQRRFASNGQWKRYSIFEFIHSSIDICSHSFLLQSIIILYWFSFNNNSFISNSYLFWKSYCLKVIFRHSFAINSANQNNYNYYVEDGQDNNYNIKDY